MQVITVNGVTIEHNKTVSTIAGNIALFTDGSYCRVDTREISNEGPGTIRIVSSEEPAADDNVPAEPKFFDAEMLTLYGLQIDVRIEPYEGNLIELHPVLKRVADQYEATVRNGRLEITAARPKGGSVMFVSRSSSHYQGKSVTVINGGSVGVIGDGAVLASMSDGNISVSGGDDSSASLLVRVPFNTDITVHAQGSKATTIGDVGGKLNVDLQGSTRLSVGKARFLVANLSGSTRLTAACINDVANIDVSGAGVVTVHAGEITRLDATTSGAGIIDVRASAEVASADASGAGRIYLNSVGKMLRRSTSGGGSITLR